MATTGDERKVFCGNLSWTLTEEELSAHMSSVGNVVACSIGYYPDGRSKGWGIVEYETQEQAEAAVRELFDSRLRGRPLTVRIDKRGNPGPGSTDEVTLFVGNLPWSVSWQHLKDMFAAYGAQFAEVQAFPDGRSRGFGLVRIATRAGAEKAISALNGSVYEGRQLEVREDKTAQGFIPTSASRGPPRGPPMPPPGAPPMMGGAPPMMAPGYSFSPAPGGPAPPYGYGGGMPPPGYPMTSQAPGYNAAPGGFPAAPGAPMMGQPPYGMPPQPRPPMGPPRGGVLQPAEGRTVAVTHLPPHMAWQDVKDLFKPYGPEFVDVKRGPDGRSMGVAVVRFGTTEGTERSIQEMNGYSVEGNPIGVRLEA